MRRVVDNLADILEKQIQNYQTLKVHILDKRKAIESNDLKKLAAAIRQIEDLIASNSRLEIERMELVKTLAENLGLSQAKPTLAQISEHLESPLSERLLELRRRASDAIQDVNRHNRINAEMLKYSSELIDSVLRRLVEDGSCEPTYSSSGKTKGKVASISLLDQQV